VLSWLPLGADRLGVSGYKEASSSIVTAEICSRIVGGLGCLIDKAFFLDPAEDTERRDRADARNVTGV